MAAKKRTVNTNEFVNAILPANTPSFMGMIPGQNITKLLINAYILGREHEAANVKFIHSDGSTVIDWDPESVRRMFGTV